MSKKELKNVLDFVTERGAVHESEIWKAFMKSDSKHEQVRIKWIIEDLNMKGLIEHGYNKQGDCIVRPAKIIYQ